MSGLTTEERHAAWCRQQWQTIPHASRVPQSWPPRLLFSPPLLPLAVLHKVILLVLAGYSSEDAYDRAEVEEELRQREHTIAAELASRPGLSVAVEEAKEADSLDPIYYLAGMTVREIGAWERSWREGMSAKEIARDMSTNKDRPEVPVGTAEQWIKRARAKLRALSEEVPS